MSPIVTGPVTSVLIGLVTILDDNVGALSNNMVAVLEFPLV